MTAMTERVARAICEKDPDADMGCVCKLRTDGVACESFKVQARAAIAEMREMTPEMLAAVQASDLGVGASISVVWNSVIDAALGEGE